MVTARHHILTNEYRLNVSTNKTGDCLVRGYTMCGRSYTARRVKWLLWDLSPMVFGRKSRLSILLVSLFSGSYLTQTFSKMWGCQQENKTKKKRKKPKGTGTSWALKERHFFCLCPSPCQKCLCFVASHLAVSSHRVLLSKAEDSWSNKLLEALLQHLLASH